MSEQPKCELCGEPMPVGEEMFKYHGHSGPCPNSTAARKLQREQLAVAKPELAKLLDEKEELDKRLTALHKYMDSPDLGKLQVIDQDALMRQEMHMTTYSNILGERIARLEQN